MTKATQANIEAAISTVRYMKRLYKNAIRQTKRATDTYKFREYLDKRYLTDGLCNLLSNIEERNHIKELITPMIDDAVAYHNAIRGTGSVYVIHVPPGVLLSEVGAKCLSPRYRLLELFEQKLLTQLNP